MWSAPGEASAGAASSEASAAAKPSSGESCGAVGTVTSIQDVRQESLRKLKETPREA